tara:strand:+ start:160 stop:507 length:348 start_codon:yes stop_codon:yes gene_type:complete
MSERRLVSRGSLDVAETLDQVFVIHPINSDSFDARKFVKLRFSLNNDRSKVEIEYQIDENIGMSSESDGVCSVNFGSFNECTAGDNVFISSVISPIEVGHQYIYTRVHVIEPSME